jgi:hypothetical protein
MQQTLLTRGVIAIATLAGATLLSRPASATNMQILVTYDSTVTALPNAAQFETAFSGVVSQFESAITNPISVDIYVSAGTINGSTTPLPAGDPSGSFDTRTAMGSTAAASFANTQAALQAIGDTVGADPTGGATYYMPQAEVKALGLPAGKYPTSAPYDGYIGFTSNMALFSFSGRPGAGQYAFQAAAMHEIEEVLGRTSFLNNAGTLYQSLATPMDLFRYSAPGVTSYTENTPNGVAPAYASIDGGVTDLGTFADQTTGGDRTDWQTPNFTTSTDAQNATLYTGENEGLSISDEDLLKALGYTIAPNNGNGLFSGANAPVGASPGVNTVPEPATAPLLVAGIGLTALTRRRPRRLAAS